MHTRAVSCRSKQDFKFLKNLKLTKYYKQDCLSVKSRSPVNSIQRTQFLSCDLEFDPMTLIYDMDVCFLKMYM